MPEGRRIPPLPRLLKSKLYKTGQTRGADDDVIYQNRVARNSTVLIPYDSWNIASSPPPGDEKFERGFIALISPERYFSASDIHKELQDLGLNIGVNALVFYEKRKDWKLYNPEEQGWKPAASRTSPLGGQYVARVPATTSAEGSKINRGFTTTTTKGAGIRIYEYASSNTIKECRLQLEALFWFCADAVDVALAQGMSEEDIAARRESNREDCEAKQLLNIDELMAKRLLSRNGRTMCPLCLEEVSAAGFFNKVEQAEGRAMPDLTITELNLFHIEELRPGRYGHRPYNVGWGHHHCNVVVKDSGIDKTLAWMEDIIDKNVAEGYLEPRATDV